MATSSRKGGFFALIGTLVVVLALIGAGMGVYRWVTSQWAVTPVASTVRCESTIETKSASLAIDQAENASIIAAVAIQHGLIPRATSIALATAFQESQIRNIDYGDRDSLGLFQQRPSQGWGTPEEIMDPYYSSAEFYDVLVTVDDWQSADIGDVAQEVQRSGFPDAYDQHVSRARLLASALSGETPASWSCIVRDPGPADPSQLADELKQGYGWAVDVSVTEATGADPAVLTVSAASEQAAWSAASFAQSWASRTGVTSVQVGDYQWTASPTVLSGWIGLPETGGDPLTVTVSF